MTERQYLDHINDWCVKCKSEATAKHCKKCYLPDLSDDGKIGQPSEFEAK